jgi:uncharacterized membrane protein
MRDVTMLPALTVECEEREIDLDSVVLSLGTFISWHFYLSARRSDRRRSPARE